MTSVLIEPASEAFPPAELAPPPRIRLDMLDGLRGIAALSVVLTHVMILVDSTGAWRPLLIFLKMIPGGTMAVAVFIVLSGYCLMLPIVRETNPNQDPDTLGGFLPYVGRRARRILPAYYGTIALALMMMALWRGGQPARNSWWASMWPGFSKGILWSHLFLLHNWNEHWVYKIDAPLWSVATEWQIYFLFPLLLLPILRRMGSVASIICGTGLGLLPIALFKRYDWAAPWLAGLFAMGMAAARTHPNLPGTSARGTRLPWGWLCIAALIVVVATRVWEEYSLTPAWRRRLAVDLVVGVWASCFLSWAVRRLTQERMKLTVRRSLTLRVLQSRWAMKLGSCSYSLYLVHALVLISLAPLIVRLPLGPNGRLIAFVVLGLGCSVMAAYLFHLVLERPFQRKQIS